MRQVSYVQWLVLVLTQRAKEQVFPQVKDNFQSNVDLKIILAKENSKYVYVCKYTSHLDRQNFIKLDFSR